jgi:hypothetical protein
MEIDIFYPLLDLKTAVFYDGLGFLVKIQKWHSASFPVLNI